MKHIFVFGPICSGKTTLAKEYCSTGNYKHIEVSKIVKVLSNAKVRGDFADTKHLDKQIAKSILKEIELSNIPSVVDGIRQSFIIDYLIEQLGRDNVLLVWKEVNTEERKRRFEERNSTKDNISFEESEKIDEGLGLNDLKKHLEKYYEPANIS